MKGFYRVLKDTKLPSCYKVAVIARACQVLASRKKSDRRGTRLRYPKPLKPVVCITSGFFITMKGRLFIPLRRDEYFDVQLGHYVMETVEGKKVRSLTVTSSSLSLCYSDDVKVAPAETVYGVDRNEKNLTFGDSERVIQVDMTKAIKVKQMTREVVGSFKRNDARVRSHLARKYWRRAFYRTNSLLHAATNFVIETASRDRAAIAIEDLTDISRMYRKGNGQTTDYRFRLNSWPHWKAKRMLEYKSGWSGLTLIQLTKSETYGSSSKCSACGEKLHNPERGDTEHRRMLWCQTCSKWIDRDVNAALNLSTRGLARFASSLPRSRRKKDRSQQADLTSPSQTEEKGLAGEAVRGNGTKTLILRVDASKLIHPAWSGELAEPALRCRGRP